MRKTSRGRRRHRRVKFAYPMEFKFLSSEDDQRSFRGLFMTMSTSGAAFKFSDKYGLVEPEKILNSRIKIEISIPQEEKIFLFAEVCWAQKAYVKNELTVFMGIQFEDLADWQLESLERVISLRNKEHKMMWNLWDRFAEEGVM